MSRRPVLGGGRVAVRGRARGARPVRRASAGLSPVRAGAGLAMLLSAAAVYGVASSPAFGFRTLDVEGARFTDRAELSARLAVPPGVNLVALTTDPLEDRVAQLPTVAAVRISVRLPDTLAVTISEREPILVWQVGERRFLVDAAGALFAELGPSPPAEAAALPVVADRRSTSAGVAVGDLLATVDLDAATRLGSLDPSDVGSAASRLTISVSDAEGYVVRAEPAGWTAVFGFYTPTLRTPELIPGQVRLLRSLLAARETEVDRVILASDTDGTYIPRTSPSPSTAP